MTYFGFLCSETSNNKFLHKADCSNNKEQVTCRALTNQVICTNYCVWYGFHSSYPTLTSMHISVNYISIHDFPYVIYFNNVEKPKEVLQKTMPLHWSPLTSSPITKQFGSADLKLPWTFGED